MADSKKDASALLTKKKKVKPRKSRDADCCSVNFLKCVLHIFNVVFLVSGVGVLCVGAWSHMFRGRFVVLLPSVWAQLSAWALVVGGAAGPPLAALGALSLRAENRTTLLCYTYFLLMTFLVEAGAGALAYYYEVAVEPELQQHLNHTFLSNYALDAAITDAIDAMHIEFKCCGAVRAGDWRRSAWHELDARLRVPDSCCRSPSARCGARDHPSNIYYTGCIDQFTSHVREELIVLAAVGVGMSVIPIFGFLFSCVLYVKIKHVED